MSKSFWELRTVPNYTKLYGFFLDFCFFNAIIISKYDKSYQSGNNFADRPFTDIRKEKMNNNNLSEIAELIKSHTEVLRNDYKIKSIGIFGSFVRNEQIENSDIDILVEFSEPVGLSFFTLENYLSEILGIKVDLVTKNALKPHIGEYILKEVMYIW